MEPKTLPYYKKTQSSSSHDITPSFPRFTFNTNQNQSNNNNQTSLNKVSSKEIFFGGTQQQFQYHNHPIDYVAENKKQIIQTDQISLSKILKQGKQDSGLHNFEQKRSSNRNYSKIQQRILSKRNSKLHSNSKQIIQIYTQSQKEQNRKYAKTTNQYQLNINNVNSIGKVQGNLGNRNKVFTLNNQQFKSLNKPQYYQVSQRKYSNNTESGYLNKIGPQQIINIQNSLTKPKFGFKTADSTKNINENNTSYDDSSIISFQSSNNSKMTLNKSKSASNFFQVLQFQDRKNALKVVSTKNGNVDQYLISKIDKKEQKIYKKLKQIQKNNQAYDKKIKQKQRQIQIIKKRMQREQKQLQTYQSKINQAYQNCNENPDSLLLNSRNYQLSNENMQARVKNKTIIACHFEGMTKKLCKQILYGKCMILQTDIIQVGFDNHKKGIIQLYFTLKQNLNELQCFLENVTQNGYSLQDNFSMKVHNISKGKKIKTKINIDYLGTMIDNIGFITLRIVMKISNNSVFTQTCILPFCLYRNFIQQKQISIQNIPKQYSIITHKNKSKQVSAISNNTQANNIYNYHLVTQFFNSCDQLIKNPKFYLQTLFRNGKWIEQNIYHIDLIFKGFEPKSMNILINCRNFAIQLPDLKNMDVVTTVGNFLIKTKSKIQRI